MVQNLSESLEEALASDVRLLHRFASNLCSLGMQPIVMTGFFRDLLIKHFAEALNIEDPDLRHLTWREDERTNILIESIYRWRPELTEFRPAVLIKRNSYQIMKMGIGHSLKGTDDRGDEHFEDFEVGSHTLFCIHSSGAAAEILSTEVKRELKQFGPLISQSLGLNQYQVQRVGAISELEEAVGNYVVPVTVGWAYSDKWSLKPDVLPLSRISLEILTQF